uniref:Uncharacterized protein n=1 Tax=Pyxicephalus adspersus TaxID=30357 RepID=A0AAV2ZPL8_PYXAD|nr:TPA: hypothetical protein GDO54_003497 [Pyxicephalus adspersus]
MFSLAKPPLTLILSGERKEELSPNCTVETIILSSGMPLIYRSGIPMRKTIILKLESSGTDMDLSFILRAAIDDDERGLEPILLVAEVGFFFPPETGSPLELSESDSSPGYSEMLLLSSSLDIGLWGIVRKAEPQQHYRTSCRSEKEATIK